MPGQTASQEQVKVLNGVNVSALMDTIDAVKKNPEIATFHFRGKNTWLGGDHNRSTIKEFYGACEEHRTASTPFVIDNGEPPVLLGQDKGANPVEHLLNALMGCMTTTMAYHAASRGIEIEAIDTESEGDIDLRGFLGLSDKIRKGYRRRVQLGAGGRGRRNLLTRICTSGRVCQRAPPDAARAVSDGERTRSRR